MDSINNTLLLDILNSLSIEDIFNLIITNTLGETLIQKTNFNPLETIDVTEIQKGIYFLRIENETGYKVFRFLKE